MAPVDLVLEVRNTGNTSIEVMALLYDIDNGTEFVNETLALGPGARHSWSVNITLGPRVRLEAHYSARSQQTANPTPPSYSSAQGATVHTGECAAGGRIRFETQSIFQAAPVPVAGPYVSEEIRSSGSLAVCEPAQVSA